MNMEKLIRQIKENNWEVHGMEIFHNGRIIHQYGDCNENRYPIYSATKAFTSTAAGIAVGEGKFSIHESLHEYLKTEIPSYCSQQQINCLKKITMERLLTMSVQGYPFRPEGEDWLSFCLTYPLERVEEPVFAYSNIPAYLVGVALEKVLGEHIISYLTPRLFEPLKINQPVYGNCPAGHFYGASQMELTVDELGRLGQVYLQKGSYNGQKIIEEDWAESATSSHISCREGGYGYFLWKYRDGFRISGKWGQRCFVFPQRNLMITYLSNMEQGSDLLTQAVDDFLLEDRNGQ